MTDICALSADELARRIRDRDISPVEAVRASLDRIDRVQPRLNPFCFVYPEEALAAARAAEDAVMSRQPLGALHGVPFAFKDFTPTKGQRTTRGSYCFEDWVPDFDPVIVRRFRAAGAITVGKTTTPEFAYSSFTHSPLWGHTRNPWNPTKTSGGSSGGSGVAVATGCVPIAEGTDMGGSVRIPAALCGIVGLKPSLGRIPMDILDTVFDDMSHFGTLARTVEDAALFLRIAEGPDDADINSQIVPLPLPERLEGDVAGLRIALSPDLGFYAVDDAVAANLRAVADALVDAGAQVEEVALDWTADIVPAWLDWWGVYQAAAFSRCLETHRERMDPDLVNLIERGLKMDAVAFKRIEHLRTRQWRALAEILRDHQALICPTMALPAADVDVTDADFGRIDAEGRLYEFDMTSPFNMVAQCPALSVPSGMTADGLPTGVQIVARRFDDPTALRIGGAIERLRPWKSWTPDALTPDAGCPPAAPD